MELAHFSLEAEANQIGWIDKPSAMLKTSGTGADFGSCANETALATMLVWMALRTNRNEAEQTGKG